jgi:hypothetical protein
MSHVDRRLAAALGGAGLLALAGCGGTTASGAGPNDPPSRLIAVQGVEQRAVALTDRAQRRLGIRTEAVRTPAAGEHGTIVIPFAALLYDPEGKTWAYVLTGTRTYLRQPVSVQDVVGADVLLGSGPPVGTPVVTVGVAELFGTEMGVEE